MSEWTDVAPSADIAPGTCRVVNVDDVMIAVVNIEGSFYAIEDLCTHDGGDLASGCIEGEEIVCPRHRARFNVKSGAVTAPPAYEDIATFPVRIEDGVVQVRDDRWD